MQILCSTSGAVFPAPTATAPRNLCLAGISARAFPLCLLRIRPLIFIKPLFPRTLCRRAPRLAMIAPSFLFLFSHLVSVFTFRIRNLLLGTVKTSLFPCVPINYCMSSMSITGYLLGLVIFSAPSSLNLLLLPLSQLGFHLLYYVVRNDFNPVQTLLLFRRQCFAHPFLPHLPHHAWIRPKDH